jgi:hypothetical protein
MFKVQPHNPLTPTPSTRAGAEAYFRKALDIARQQQAKSLELRAVMSLVRLGQQQATHTSLNTHHVSRNWLTGAHTRLAEVYGEFTEGFETQDLQDAKVLLDALACNPGVRFSL